MTKHECFSIMSEKEKYDDSEYIGNIWGWKVSLYSLAFILSMLALMWYISWKRGTPIHFEDPDATTETDSLSLLDPASPFEGNTQEPIKPWEWS
ncbi:MAG: hypothetical protein AAFV80_14315 [Bacteroidota bacterium]